MQISEYRRIPRHSKAPLQRNWLRSEVDHLLPLTYEAVY